MKQFAYVSIADAVSRRVSTKTVSQENSAPDNSCSAIAARSLRGDDSPRVAQRSERNATPGDEHLAPSREHAAVLEFSQPQ